MPSRYPNRPFRIDPRTSVCDRLRILEALAAEGTQDPLVRQMAWRIEARARVAGPQLPVRRGDWWKRVLALEALAAVQSLPFRPDPGRLEWFQPAGYTARFGGDCEDLVVLFVSLCRLLGLRAQVEWINQPGKPLNHVTSRVFLEGGWWWAESSIRGAMLGESPYEAAERLGNFAPLGETAPAGQVVITGGWYGYPWQWWGWNSLWQDYPYWWFQRYYPWLWNFPVYQYPWRRRRPAPGPSNPVPQPPSSGPAPGPSPVPQPPSGWVMR